jgi:hypothetical protein
MCDALSFADPADANRDPNRLVAHADEKPTAFLELESTTLGLRSSAAGPPELPFPN